MFLLLLLTLLGMAWGFRSLLIGLVVQSAERGTMIPVSLTLSRVPVPVGEVFHLSLPARRVGDGWFAYRSLVLTSGRVRLVRRGRVELDVPLSKVEHLTVQGFSLRIARRGEATPLALQVAQPAAIARYIRYLATAAAGPARTAILRGTRD